MFYPSHTQHTHKQMDLVILISIWNLIILTCYNIYQMRKQGKASKRDIMPGHTNPPPAPVKRECKEADYSKFTPEFIAHINANRQTMTKDGQVWHKDVTGEWVSIGPTGKIGPIGNTGL